MDIVFAMRVCILIIDDTASDAVREVVVVCGTFSAAVLLIVVVCGGAIFALSVKVHRLRKHSTSNKSSPALHY